MKFYIFCPVLYIVLITTISEDAVADRVYGVNNAKKLILNKNQIDLSRNEQMNQFKHKSFRREQFNESVHENDVNDILEVSLINF